MPTKIRPAYFLLLSFYVLLTHGIVLFNRGVFYDGWATYPSLRPLDYGALSNIYYGNGKPLYLYIQLLTTLFADILLGYRILFIIALLSTTFAIYLSCKIVGFTDLSSYLISALSSSFPAFLVGYEVNIFPYVIDYMVFMWGICVYLITIFKTLSLRIKYSLRCFAVLLYLISFDLNSLLVFFYPFVALFLLCEIFLDLNKDFTKQNIKKHIVYLVEKQKKKFLFLLLLSFLPIIWWTLNHYFFPLSELFSNYNNYNYNALTFRNWGFNSIVFVAFSAVIPILESISIPFRLPFLFFICLIVFCLSLPFLLFEQKNISRYADRKEKKIGYFLIIWGVILFVGSAVPYIAVGKVPIYGAWETRHAILVGLPLSFLYISFLGIVSKTKNIINCKTFFLSCLFLLVSFSSRHIENYLMWQARWLKDSSFMENLAHHPTASKFSIYYIQDEWLIEDHSLLYKYDSNYEFWEYAGMFRLVWGEQTRTGFDLKTKDWQDREKLVTEHVLYRGRQYNHGDLDITRQCKATLILSKTDTRSDMKIALDYIVNQIVDPALNKQPLTKLSKLEVIPHPDNRCL